MDNRKIQIVRNRTMHSLSPTTAAYAGLTVFQLQQFVAGMVHPSEEQLLLLARYLGVEEQIR